MLLRSIEHVYLAYSGGTPLVHLSRFEPEDADPDLIASMFAAVQTFMDDSFHSLGIGRVRSIEMDRHQHVAFGRGEYALLYVLYRGWESNRLERKVEETVRNIEQRFGGVLRDWNGDMDRIAPLSEYLKRRFGVEADLHVHERAKPLSPESGDTAPEPQTRAT